MASHDIAELGDRIEAAGGVAAMLLALDGVVLVDDRLTALGRQSERRALRLVEELERRQRAARLAAQGPPRATDRADRVRPGAVRALRHPRPDPPGWITGPPAADVLRAMSRREVSRMIDALLAGLSR